MKGGEVATVLTVYGIETRNDAADIAIVEYSSRNSTYRLRY